jgi:seryl-tRNA synthetase
MLCFDWQAKLQQQLHNAEATEDLIKAELAAAKQQLQQTLQEVQQVSAEAAAAAEAATARHEAELQQLQMQLGTEGASQVPFTCCRMPECVC